MTTLTYLERNLQFAIENNHAWSVYPSEAAALLDELKRLREQRALENEDLTTAWDKGRAAGVADAEARVIAYLRARTKHRAAQAQEARAAASWGGHVVAIEAKAGEAEALADGIEKGRHREG